MRSGTEIEAYATTAKAQQSYTSQELTLIRRFKQIMPVLRDRGNWFHEEEADVRLATSQIFEASDFLYRQP